VSEQREKPQSGQRRGSGGDGDRPDGLESDQRRGSGRDQPDGLEQLIDGLARSQPTRRAPASLESRVFARIAATPWWRKGFAYWPLPARAAFLVASCGFIKLALASVMWVMAFVRTSDVTGVDAVHRTSEAVLATVSLGGWVLHTIPPLWLYSGAAVGFTLYAVLFGLGTFAYRTLYLRQ